MPRFSANQMNSATSSQPSSSGIQRGVRNGVNHIRVRQNNSPVAANNATRMSGSQ